MATTVFGYTGAPQTFTVPPQCTSVHAVLVGAGSHDHLAAKFSSGGTTTIDIPTTPGETLYIGVGGEGGKPGNPSLGLGGYNGGGRGGSGPSGGGGGGSGASDVRQGGPTYDFRVAVAGGSGGYHVIEAGADSTHGGHGGGTTGEDGNGSGAAGSGGGGSQTVGGSSGTSGQDGSIYQGGSSTFLGSSLYPYGPGGGGGGYYGGGSGFPGGTGVGLAGGGGSGWVNPSLGGVVNGGTFFNGVAGQYTAPANGSVTLTYNVAPDKPTVPALPTNFRVDEPLPVPFFYNDEPSDTMSQANIRWRPDTVPAWSELDDVAVTGSDTAGYVYTFPAHFADGYEGTFIDIEVQTVDSSGATSPWSTLVSSTPITGGSSSDVVITAPAQIYSQTPAFAFALSSGASFTGAKVQCWTDVAGDPGAQLCEIGFTQSGTLVNFVWDTSGSGVGVYEVSDPGFEFTTDSKYHFLVAIETSPFVYTDFADSGPILVTLNSPQAADIIAIPLPNTSPPAIRLEITNYHAGIDPFPASYNDIYRADLSGDTTENIRIAHGVPLNGAFTDYLPGLTVQYQYTVVPVYVAP